MSKIIYIFWIISTIINITNAQYVSADTMRIQPLLFQADTLFQQGKHDAAFAKADTVRSIIAQIFDQNGIATSAIVHLKVKAIYFQQGKDKEQQAIHQIESLLKQPLPKFYIQDSIEQAKNYWFWAKLYYQLKLKNLLVLHLIVTIAAFFIPFYSLLYPFVP